MQRRVFGCINIFDQPIAENSACSTRIAYLRILGDQEVSKSRIFKNTLLFAQCVCNLSEKIFFSAVAGLTAAKGLALALQANDPHTNAFTLAILRLHESLYLANLKRKWWKTECPKEPNSSK